MPHFKAFPRISLLAVVLATAAQAGAAPIALRNYRALALDAAGAHIAGIESDDPGGLPAQPHSKIVVRAVEGGKIVAEYDPCATCSYDEPAWSPDQKSLSFIASDSKAGNATVYVATDGKLAALAVIKGIGNSARWAPDGKQLALLATVDAKKLTGAAEAGARQVGEIGAEEDEQRIAVVAAHGGALRLVSPADTFVYEYDWTPDGKGFVATSAKGNGDNNWWIATLGHVDLASGALRTLAAPKMQITVPRVSNDGKTVAFIGGLMSDFGVVGGDVFTVPLAGGEVRNITPGFAGSFNTIAWRGNGLLAAALVGANQTLMSLGPAAKAVRSLWSAPVSASGASDARFVFSADGKLVASVFEDFGRAPHIVAGPLTQPAPLTHDNDSFAPQVSARSISWTSGGHQVQGWLVAPLKVDAGKKHPMVVVVHGGPSGAAAPRFVAEGEQANTLVRDLTQRGYFVFYPNPRGSFGQGSAFVRGNVRGLGGGDWRDILAGVDAAIKTAPIDGARLGLMGHSYGGFMTMWGVAHSNRFKAAVAGAGIANWISYYGQNGIDQWMVPFFGATMYDDPAAYRAASPIESVKSVKTPTFMYVGERDVECPAVQSVEFWHALKAMGTPTSLVIYDGEGHVLRQPANQRDMRERTVKWFEKYLSLGARQ